MAGLLLLLILPIVSADIIMPGQHSIQINNKIINICNLIINLDWMLSGHYNIRTNNRQN